MAECLIRFVPLYLDNKKLNKLICRLQVLRSYIYNSILYDTVIECLRVCTCVCVFCSVNFYLIRFKTFYWLCINNLSLLQTRAVACVEQAGRLHSAGGELPAASPEVDPTHAADLVQRTRTMYQLFQISFRMLTSNETQLKYYVTLEKLHKLQNECDSTLKNTGYDVN